MKAIITLTLVLSASMSFAAPIAYDGMGGTLGTEFNGSAEGTGWADAWTSDKTLQTGDFVFGPGLSYTDGSANSLVTTDNGFLNQTQNLGNPANFGLARNLSAPVTSGEFYLSVLFQEANYGHDYFLQMVDGSGGANGLVARGSWGAGQNWRVGAATTTMPLPVNGETQFMVIQMDLDANSISVWQNPDLVTPGTPDYTGAYDLVDLSSVKFFVKNEAPEEYTWDELRVGTTFEAVAPVIPEPSTLALLGLAGLALVTRKRK